MDKIKLLEERIRQELPGISTSLDEPKNPDEVWWLDLELGERRVAVQWFPRTQEFGITRTGEGVGVPLFHQHPDEIFPDLESTARRAIELLQP